MEATTLPPRELKNTIRLSLASELPAFRKSTKACGVSASMTPSATITCGQRAPQSPPSRGSTRNVMEPGSAQAAEEAKPGASATETAAASQIDRTIGAHFICTGRLARIASGHPVREVSDQATPDSAYRRSGIGEQLMLRQTRRSGGSPTRLVGGDGLEPPTLSV